MRFRTGVVVGFAAGYYLGAKAGRERYEQIRRVLDEVPIGRIGEKARALVDLAIERLRDADDAVVVPLRPTADDSRG